MSCVIGGAVVRKDQPLYISPDCAMAADIFTAAHIPAHLLED